MPIEYDGFIQGGLSMKQWIINTIYILAGTTVGLSVVPALANSTLFTASNVRTAIISEQEAIDIAQNYTDELFEIMNIKFDEEDKEYNVVLENDLKKVDVEIEAKTGVVKEWDVDLKNTKLITNLITLEEAQAIALEKAGEGFTVLSVELDDDEDDFYYELVLLSIRFKIEVEVDAKKGIITNWEVKELVSNHNITLISVAEVKRLALEKAGPTYVIVSVEIEEDDDDLIYEVKLSSPKRVIEAEYNAITGELLEWEIKYNRSNRSNQTNGSHTDPQTSENGRRDVVRTVITRDEAIAIARRQIGDTPVLINFSLDNEDDYPEYNLEFKSGSKEYSIEINALSGVITEFEIEE